MCVQAHDKGNKADRPRRMLFSSTFPNPGTSHALDPTHLFFAPDSNVTYFGTRQSAKMGHEVS